MTTATASTPAPTTVTRIQTPVTIPVAGVTYTQDIVRGLQVGERLVLQRDHNNEVDQNAIEVVTLSGQRVGFVPAKLLDRFIHQDHERWGGEVVEIYPAKTWGIRVRVTHLDVPEVHVTGPQYRRPAPQLQDVPGDAMGSDQDSAGFDKAFSKAGRYLGTITNSDDSGLAYVVDPDGNLTIYPKRSILVEPADTCTEPAGADSQLHATR